MVIILSILTLLVVGCKPKTSENLQTISSQVDTLVVPQQTKIDNGTYEKDNGSNAESKKREVELNNKKFDYIFSISTNQNTKNFPENLTVEIINNESGAIKLYNLVFDFYVVNDESGNDWNGYWATTEKVRFLDKALIIKSKEHFRQTIPISSFKFESFKNNQHVSITEMETMFKNSKHTRIVASMDDLRRLENPLESSSRTWSNVIELK